MSLIFGRISTRPDVFGFAQHQSAPGPDDLIRYDGDAPTCVIASTGSGKGRDFIIPNLLTYPGPVIVLDTKGELSAVCGRARRAMGQAVHILDPFGVTGQQTDRLNPFDQFALAGAMLEPDAEMFASLLGDGHAFAKDPFWPDTAGALISGVVAYIAAALPPEQRSMRTLRDMLLADDVDYSLAVLADEKKATMPPFAYRALCGYLQHAEQNTRPSVLSTARTFLTALSSDQIAACLEDSTIALADVLAGKPMSIFITVPPEKLTSHRCLLRLWVGVLLTTIMRRKQRPKERTLFVLDEAAQLGTFDPLLTATTLLRGYGLQVITVWQDLAQMKSRYPSDWPTVLNNSAALLAFGFGHYAAAKDYADVLGIEASRLATMKSDEAALALRGEGSRMITRISYLTEPSLSGLFDENPQYKPMPESGTERAPEPPAEPKTWKEKVAHTHAIFKAMMKDDDSVSEDQVFAALVHLAEAVEEIGNRLPPEKKTPVRRKRGTLEA